METKKKKSENSESSEEIKNAPECDSAEKEPKAESNKGESKKENANTKLKKENETIKNELEETKEKYLRLLAEYENYRKRSQKEKSDAYTDAYSTAITSFLPLIDNLERAQEFEKDNEGLKIIVKQLEDILKGIGVASIDSDGKNFDPNFHNAIMHDEDDNGEENMIVQTLQKGYMFGDKVIRHAMVKVIN